MFELPGVGRGQEAGGGAGLGLPERFLGGSSSPPALRQAAVGDPRWTTFSGGAPAFDAHARRRARRIPHYVGYGVREPARRRVSGRKGRAPTPPRKSAGIKATGNRFQASGRRRRQK